jgi:hypothetical protein
MLTLRTQNWTAFTKANAMTYDEALAASRGRLATCGGDAALAVTCRTIAMAHALSSRMLYDGAKKLGMSESDVRHPLRDSVLRVAEIMWA